MYNLGILLRTGPVVISYNIHVFVREKHYNLFLNSINVLCSKVSNFHACKNEDEH